jgi:hypothetical protein
VSCLGRRISFGKEEDMGKNEQKRQQPWAVQWKWATTRSVNEDARSAKVRRYTLV